MGGYGSGRSGGRPTVEQALRLDIDDVMRWGGIRAGSHLAGEMRFNFYDDQIDLKFESRVGDPTAGCACDIRYPTTGRARSSRMVKDGRMPSPKRINSRTVWDRKRLDEAFDALPGGNSDNPWDDAAA
jgi:hypothetical protein